MSSVKPSNFTSTVAGGAILISVVGILSKGLGVVRETIFASYFGLSNEFDIYLVGNVIPVTLTTVFYYFCQNYFIPIYNVKKQKSKDALNSFFTLALVIFTLVGLIISLLLFIFSHDVVGLFVDTSDLNRFNLALNIFQILLIIIPIGFIIAVLSSKLQAEYNFRIPAFAQLVLNTTIIAFVLIFANGLGVYAIVIGYITGTIIQILYIYIKSKTVISISKYYFHLNELREFLTPGIILILFVEIFGQIFFLADRVLYKYVDVGGIAALNYAYTVFNLPIAVFSVALSTVLLPRFSELVSNNDNEQVNDSLNKFFAVNLFIFVPIFLILVFQGQLVIEILFERGNFDRFSSQITFESLRYLALSIVFYSTYSGINKLIYSHRLLKEIFLISLITVSIKFLLNFVLVKDYQQNGLAISSAVCYSLIFFLGYFVLIKKNIIKGTSDYLQNLFMIVLIGLFSYYSIYIIFQFIFPQNLITKILFIIFFTLLYFLTAYKLNQSSVKILLSSLTHFRLNKEHTKIH